MITGREFVQVDFKYKDSVVTIKLYSKYTRISGDSGEGKSKFVESVNDCIVNSDPYFSYTVSNGFPIICVTVDTDITSMTNLTDTVILLDDTAMQKANRFDKLLRTNNLFIFVCRSTGVCGMIPLIGSYTLDLQGDWFSIDPIQFPIYRYGDHVDTIITESAKDRSEHALLSAYRDDIVPAFGQCKVLKQLRINNGTKLVLLDLGNIGDVLPALLEYMHHHNDVYFYDYQAFEELLCKSPLLRHLIHDESHSVFTEESLEKYYEHVLEECTRNTEFEYKHKHPILADPYLDKANFNKIFDSEVGRALIPLLSNGDGSSFNAVEYLQNKAGDKFKYFTQLQIDSCATQEDCDQLLHSLRWLD